MRGLTVQFGITLPAECFKLDKNKSTEYVTYYKLVPYGDWWLSNKINYIREEYDDNYEQFCYTLGYFDDNNEFVVGFYWGYLYNSIFEDCRGEICQE